MTLMLMMSCDAFPFVGRPRWSRNRLSFGTRADKPLFASLKYKNIEEMLDSFEGIPVVIVFTAEHTCGPCVLQQKEIKAFKEMLDAGGALRTVSVNVQRYPGVASKFSVAKLPCVVMVKDREVLVRLEGLTKADVLAEHVRAYL